MTHSDAEAPRIQEWAARGHCTPQWGGHSPACLRDGQFCSKIITHDGPCVPHGKRPDWTEAEKREAWGK